MSGRSSRRKGHDFERYVARLFREVLPESRRGLQSQSGELAPDVDCPPFWIECKVGAAPRVEAALLQAEREAHKGRIPIAVTKRAYRKPIVSLRLENFLEILERWRE